MIEKHWAVTLPSPWDTDAIITALAPANFPHPLWVRVVLDANVKKKYGFFGARTITPALTEYGPVLTALRFAGFKVLLCIADSSVVKKAFPEALDYEKRCRDVYEVLGKPGGLYNAVEVGNEVNGTWLGPGMPEKVTRAYRFFAGHGACTVLTLYSDPWGRGGTPEMREWSAKNLPEDVRRGLDFVGVSHYDDDVGPRNDWEELMNGLGVVFPNSSLGILECGTKNPDQVARFIRRYYGIRPKHPRWVGGAYWWYGEQFVSDPSAPIYRHELAQAISFV